MKRDLYIFCTLIGLAQLESQVDALPTAEDLAANTIAIATKADADDLNDLAEDMAAKDADLESQVTMAAEQLLQLTAMQAQIDGLTNATSSGSNSGDSGDSHFMCANGYAGVGCSIDATRPQITCPEHTVTTQLAVFPAASATVYKTDRVVKSSAVSSRLSIAAVEKSKGWASDCQVTRGSTVVPVSSKVPRS